MSIYIDLTEFLAHPITTGIQRVTVELCRRFPPDTVIPIRLHQGSYTRLSHTLQNAVRHYFRDASTAGAQEIRRLVALEVDSAIRINGLDTVLISDVFFERERVAFFCALSDLELRRYRFVVHDLLPLTHPEYFTQESEQDLLCGYFHILSRACFHIFTSEEVREIFWTRLKRRRAVDSIICPLGSDSLGARPETVCGHRSLQFVALGTVEPRKNHGLILDAFEALRERVEGARLLFIGRMGWVDTELRRKIEVLASQENSGFNFHSGANDAAIRSHLEKSRASLYVSGAEGYGLPAVESLWAGTPVIVSRVIPSLRAFGPAGIQYVEPINIQTLREAMTAFLDDEYADRKIKETLTLELPTWQSFADGVLTWCVADQF